MKRRLFALLLLPVSLSTMALTDLGAKGDLKFTLQIRQGACELVKENIDVDMGKAVLKRPVRIGSDLNPTPFSIGLKNCSEVIRVYVTMDGQPDTDDPNLFALDAGGATGVGLKIKTADGVQQYPKSTHLTPLEFAIASNGSHQLNYIASYVPLRADATIGRADATVDFTVQYE
ncbi:MULTISPECIES: long polar fimbrial protein LpfE [Escherichia]|uniref:long polar fimbrial protein LpfE n=1 Tax=Escherichia TaxID=561 RepID=UPI0007E46948|nr:MULTISPECIES: long polar fimbrial protein LpfE [Escherichia]MEC9494437.1 long polar fimbrial protein LpfE [Escherichia whittamii]MEC9560826.1 long polar fimbrial protein LpfE [Escherichia whittamii]QLX46720.1 long polar fimbrial protein LpfE [Escherichia coli]